MSDEKIQQAAVIEDDEIDLGALLKTLWDAKFKIVLVTGLFAVLSVAYALSLPNIYKASATFLLPQSSDSKLSGVMAQLSSIPFLGASLPGGGGGGVNSFEKLKVYLQKRENLWKVINHFNLQKHYKLETKYLKGPYTKKLEMKTPVEKKYTDSFSMEIDKKSGVVTLSISDKNPEFATEVANYNVKLLDEISLGTAMTENRKKREFLEQRLIEVKQQLQAIELQVKEYGEKNNILSLKAQVQATIGAASMIQSELLVNQTKLKVKLEMGTNENHPDIKLLKLESDALQRHLKRVEDGGLVIEHEGLDESDIAKGLMYVPLNKIPQLQMDMTKLTQKASVLKDIFKVLSKEYELAKIDSSKDQEFIEIVDWARVPERKDKPRRSIICIVVTMTGFLLACFGVLVFDGLRKNHHHPHAAVLG